MITLNHTIAIEVDFETIEDAETFRDAIREFIKEYQFHMGCELDDHTDIAVLDRVK